MSIRLKGDKEISKVLTIKQKALQINLNENIYGTFGPPKFDEVSFKVNSGKKVTLKINID